MDTRANEFFSRLMKWLNSFLSQFKTLFNRLTKPNGEDDRTAHSGKETGDNPSRKEINLLLYVLLGLLLFSLFSSSGERQQNEISYGKFLAYVKDAKIERAIVTDRFITGFIKPDKAEDQPKPFTTIPLWQTDLASLLTEHKVDFVVRPSEGWLTGIFSIG